METKNYEFKIENSEEKELDGIYKEIKDTNIIPTFSYNDNNVFKPFFIYLLTKNNNKLYGLIPLPCINNIINYPVWVISQLKMNNNNQGILIKHLYYTKLTNGNFNKKFKDVTNIPCLDTKYWKSINSNNIPKFTITCIQKKISNDNINSNSNDINDDSVPDNESIELSTSNENKVNIIDDIKVMDNNEEKDEIKFDNKKMFDVDDVKIVDINQVGIDNVLRITDDINVLTNEWNVSEIGPHDELNVFLNSIGKVIDIDDDDNTAKVEWKNKTTSWIPVKACYLTWKLKPTNPAPLNDNDGNILNDDVNAIRNNVGL